MNKSCKALIACAGIICLNTTVFAQIGTSFENTYFVNVSYTDNEAFSKATIQVVDENKEYPLYAGESKAVTYSQENGYTVNFKKIKLNDRLLDGTYKIKVGVGGNVEEITFDFENTPAKIRAMQRLKDAKTKQEFTSYFDEDYMFLEIDTEKYLALGELKTIFCNALFEELVFDDEAVTEDNIEEQRAVLTAGMDKQYEVVSLMCAKSNLSDVVDNLQSISVDKTYYDKMNDKTRLAEIYSSNNVDKSEQINLTDIQKAFDGACLCAVIATCDFKTAEAALLYYADKSIISEPDMSYYDLLSELEQSEVFDELRTENITDYSLVAGEFEDIAQEIYEDSKKEASKPSGGGGGGGGIIVSMPNDEDNLEEESSPSQTNKKTFPDIDNVEWAREAINSLAESGCVSGDENGYFNPNNKITREEFIKIVLIAFNKLDKTASANFEDVDKKAWYYPYVASGVKLGVAKGISEKQFGIGKNITRQDAAVILHRVYNKNTSLGELDFKDNNDISDYAIQAISELSSIGVIKGMNDGKFYPNNNLTRAEAATLIYRLKNLVK